MTTPPQQSASHWRSERVLSAMVIGVAIVVAVLVLGWAVGSIKSAENQRIVVTGAYSQQVQSNRAIWRGRLEATAPTRQAAYSALNKDKAALSAWLSKQGIETSAIEAGAVDIMPIYHREYNHTDYAKVNAYRLNQTLTVTSDDVAKVKTIAQQVGELLSTGVNVQGEPPQYLYTKLDELKVNSLGEATKNAKARAQSMAKATGASVGALRSVNMGVFQITPPDSTDVSDYGRNDTSTVDKKVTAVVNAVFQLK